MQAFRRLPVSSALLMFSCLLFASSVYLDWIPQQGSLEGSNIGALHQLSLTKFSDIFGLFDLWSGQWWRLTISAFHHANLLHLICNALSFWILADLLEPRIGRLRFLIYCVAGATFSLLPEVLIGKAAVGISGLVFAMFGTLLTLRAHDEVIAERFHGFLIYAGFASLILGIPLAMFSIMPIANGSHFGGFVYGIVIGLLCWDWSRYRRRLSITCCIAFNAAIVALVFFAMNPFWNGRYWAWRAIKEKDPSFWIQATNRDPGLVTAWIGRISESTAAGDFQQAWKTTLLAIQANRSTPDLDTIARELWLEFEKPVDQAEALDELKRIFENDTDAWLARLNLSVEPDETTMFLAEFAFPDVPVRTPDNLEVSFDIPNEVSGITQPHGPRLAPGEIDPDDPLSARLGQTL